MNRWFMVSLAIASLTAAHVTSSQAAELPVQVGKCANTSIKSIETRLVDGSTGRPIPDSGSAVSFINGGYQVGYDTLPAIEQSRAGDPVRICLVKIPKNCPKGDDRGRVYRTTNLRTHRGWTLPDSEHMCGGA
jgi:hypothetical protein